MKKKVQGFKNSLLNYKKNNNQWYILVILIFTIGVFIGVMFINNCTEEKSTIITTYISNFIEKFQNVEIDRKIMIINSLKKDLILSIIIWTAGTTIIGMPIVLGIILYRGFCLGYTISAVTYTLGTGKGIIFCISAFFMQNLLSIPALLTTGVSSIKLCKSIISDRRKENIKIEIIKHTIISIFMFIILIISSFTEIELSTRLLKFFIEFIK